MTIVTRAAVAAGMLGAFWLGVWTAPLMQETNATGQGDVVLASAPNVPAAPRPARAPDSAAAVEVTPTPADDAEMLLASDAPVQKYVKPLLTWGADASKAAEGFESAEDFVAVAHAAKNTAVPFILLKHRVLNEGQTLAEAIRASKPDLDASLEASRATLEARAQLARLGN